MPRIYLFSGHLRHLVLDSCLVPNFSTGQSYGVLFCETWLERDLLKLLRQRGFSVRDDSWYDPNWQWRSCTRLSAYLLLISSIMTLLDGPWKKYGNFNQCSGIMRRQLKIECAPCRPDGSCALGIRPG
ncbi:hypothetical protein HGRIS_011544 [Hohenbuehelia grisea]|uniref:Uncharacterized protein n=1 Tax=Hohenbuehelia grisea TaxID=104357 RepID=A0ABR3JXG6_9AGAR